MLNKLQAFLQRYRMLQPGDSVVCAVSGGADSVALLFALYLLADKLQIRVSAAHFNHHLRAEESDRDENFVRKFCSLYDIPLTVGGGQIKPGKKGLEAAAREARYSFLRALPGKIATAHTADDNAETVLMHMVRGTGLRGLGAISPINGNLIRPLLLVTREEILSFLQEYHLSYVEDSSNNTDMFLRNRLRRHIVPLLKAENPRLSENLSAMALRLREDEETLTELADRNSIADIEALRKMPSAIRSRVLSCFLEKCGVIEPEVEHITLAEKLVFSEKPSARASFPGGVTISRCYNRLEKNDRCVELQTRVLPCPGVLDIPEAGVQVICRPAEELVDQKACFTVAVDGEITVRTRKSGDAMRCSGGTKQLKKLFIDHKIPASQRMCVPVIADRNGVLGVYGFGANRDRLAQKLPAVEISIKQV